MAKTESKEIPELLAEAAKRLKEERDREVMMRLSASLRASEYADWDFKLIARMLAKAGKLDDCEVVISGMPVGWERADAFCSAAKALFEIDDKREAIKVLDKSAKEAEQAQKEGSDQDQQCASGVLEDIAELFALNGEFKAAEKAAQAIAQPIRQQRTLERLAELQPERPAEQPEQTAGSSRAARSKPAKAAKEKKTPTNKAQKPAKKKPKA